MQILLSMRRHATIRSTGLFRGGLAFSSKVEVTKMVECALSSANTTEAIANLLQTSAISKNKLEPHHLYMIARGLCKENTSIKSDHLIKIMQGLSGQTDSEAAMCQILRVVHERLPQYANTDINEQACLRVMRYMHNMNSDNLDVREMLSTITQLYSECKMSSRAIDIGLALRGFNRMSSDHKEVLDAIYVLTKKSLRKARASEFDSSLFTSIAHCLLRMTSDHPEVLLLVRTLSLKIRVAKPEFSAGQLAVILSCMRGMHSHHIDVRLLLTSLMNCYKGEALQPREVGKALAGMRNMNSNSEEVQRVLAAIGRSMDSSKETWELNTLRSVLHGISNMSSEHQEVRHILFSLTPYISAYPMTAWKDFCYFLQALCHWSCDYQQVRDLVAVITRQIESSPNSTTPTLFMLAQSMHGLQCMTAKHKEIESIMELLLTQVVASGHRALSPHGIAQLLSGVSLYCQTFNLSRQSTADTHHIALLETMSSQMLRRVEGVLETSLHESFDVFDLWGSSSHSTKDLLELCQAAQIFAFMSGGYGHAQQWYNVSQALSRLCKKRIESDHHSRSTGKSESWRKLLTPEGKLAKMLSTALHPVHSLQVTNKHAFLEGFVCDMLVENKAARTILDIEIDGPERDYPSFSIFSTRRDAFLHSLPGVTVMRLKSLPSAGGITESMSLKEYHTFVVDTVLASLGVQSSTGDDDKADSIETMSYDM